MVSRTGRNLSRSERRFRCKWNCSGRFFDAIRSLPQVEAKVDMQRRTCKGPVYGQKNYVTRFTCRCRMKIEVVARQLKFRNLACFARLQRAVGEMHFMCMCDSFRI